MSSPFETLVRQLLQVKKTVDSSLKELKDRAADIEAKYDPRREFDRWKKSRNGKAWKQQQYHQQQQCCAYCKCSVPLEGSHIDHIQPLVHYPQLAITPENLQILCANCNLRKGSQETFQNQSNSQTS